MRGGVGQPRLRPQQASFHLCTLAGPRWSSPPGSLVTPASKDLAYRSHAPTGMFRQWSVQSEPASRRPESQAASEELWEQEVERLCASRTPVRMLPCSMADRRFIRWVLLSRGGGGGGTRGCTWQMDDSRVLPVTTVLQGIAGARGSEDLPASVASPEAPSETVPEGGRATAGPRLRALGGSPLRDWG